MGDVDDFLAEIAACAPPYADSASDDGSVMQDKRGLFSRVLGGSR